MRGSIPFKASLFFSRREPACSPRVDPPGASLLARHAIAISIAAGRAGNSSSQLWWTALPDSGLRRYSMRDLVIFIVSRSSSSHGNRKVAPAHDSPSKCDAFQSMRLLVVVSRGLLTMQSRTEAMSLVKPQSKVTSIFLLTSIFNNSIHSSIAVFHLGPHIHEEWKGRIETWQQRKKVVRKRRAARRSNCSSATKTGDAQASPSFLF